MKTANFHEDVTNADNIKAEHVAYEAMVQYFSGTNTVITDLRDQHLKWDFEIRNGRLVERVDVKHDSYYERSERLPFEVYHQRSNGVIDPSWGVNSGLHWIALVPWTFSKVVLVPLYHLRAYVTFCLATIGNEGVTKERDWRPFARKNMGRGAMWTTHGWAIPEDGFRRFLTHFNLGEMPVLPTDESHHRSKPRLLLDGKEVA